MGKIYTHTTTIHSSKLTSFKEYLYLPGKTWMSTSVLQSNLVILLLRSDNNEGESVNDRLEMVPQVWSLFTLMNKKPWP
jgi:hypothetical protein